MVRHALIILHNFTSFVIKRDYFTHIYRREVITLPDGGELALDLANKHPFEIESSVIIHPKSPVIILFHGLGGSSMSEYVLFSVQKFLDAGFIVAVMNARGCGGMALINKTTYVGDKTDDLKHIVTHVKSKFRSNKIFFLGFSLGAASTLRYLGRPDVIDSCELTAAACVSPPWNVSVHTDVFSLCRTSSSSP